MKVSASVINGPWRIEAAPTLGMAQRSDHTDFSLRDGSGAVTTTVPHRHEYFQIQVHLAGDTVHHIGGAVRPLAAGTLAFVLPHRLHLVPHPPGAEFVLINFTQEFFVPQIDCDSLDLEDVPLSQAPELAPFRLQEHMDFVLPEPALGRVRRLIEEMRDLDHRRPNGALLMLRGALLTLVGIVCECHGTELLRLASEKAELRGRRAALARVMKYVRNGISSPTLSLKAAAAEAFLSPNYLSHLLRKETGGSFTDLVQDRRMRLARTQLLSSNRSVSQVAWACGYADEAYFSRCFRKVHGASPAQFRKQQP
jgi:AraC-like DNA-binding protein